MKCFILPLLTAGLLSACSSAGPNPNWVAQIEASGYDETKAVYLGGDISKGQHYGLPNPDSAQQLVNANKGKAGSLVGYIWDYKVTGNKLSLDVIPRLSGANAQLCANRSGSILGCLRKVRGNFTSSVTCHVNNLKQFYTAGGKRIEADRADKWRDPSTWSHVLVQGKIQSVEAKTVQFKRYYGGQSSISFGDTGGTYNDGFHYSSIHLDDCRVFTFRGKAILPHS